MHLNSQIFGQIGIAPRRSAVARTAVGDARRRRRCGHVPPLWARSRRRAETFHSRGLGGEARLAGTSPPKYPGRSVAVTVPSCFGRGTGTAGAAMARLIGTPGTDVGPASDVVSLSGRHRVASDLAGELMDVLADEPRVVVCDLAGMTPDAGTDRLFAPVTDYLAHWPGTVVVVRAPDPAVRAAVGDAALSGPLLVHACGEAGLSHASGLVPDVHRAGAHLEPLPTASREARVFATRALLDWQMAQLIRPVSVVVSELVTASAARAGTVLDLTLSRVGSRVRVAVHDHGDGDHGDGDHWDGDHGDGDSRAPAGHPPEVPLTGRGRLLVQAFARCWGVFPGRGGGRTVWAVLDRHGRPDG
jgi:hypothetical protein